MPSARLTSRGPQMRGRGSALCPHPARLWEPSPFHLVSVRTAPVAGVPAAWDLCCPPALRKLWSGLGRPAGVGLPNTLCHSGFSLYLHGFQSAEFLTSGYWCFLGGAWADGVRDIGPAPSPGASWLGRPVLSDHGPRQGRKLPFRVDRPASRTLLIMETSSLLSRAERRARGAGWVLPCLHLPRRLIDPAVGCPG